MVRIVAIRKAIELTSGKLDHWSETTFTFSGSAATVQVNGDVFTVVTTPSEGKRAAIGLLDAFEDGVRESSSNACVRYMRMFPLNACVTCPHGFVTCT